MSAPAPASDASYVAIRVRGAVSASRGTSSGVSGASGDARGRNHRDASGPRAGAFFSTDDDDALRDADAASRSHVARVFAQIEGGAKQAIAAATSDDGASGRAEACERACGTACERAGGCADAEDAIEVCGIACAHACERQSDARGKFEVNIRVGSEEARRWEDELRERARAERERDARLVGTDEKERREEGT